jgi:hypothetical protein
VQHDASAMPAVRAAARMDGRDRFSTRSQALVSGMRLSFRRRCSQRGVARTAVVTAEGCPSICSTDVVYGFLAGGVEGCTCSASDGSTGAVTCYCGPCYDQQSDGTVVGFAISGGACNFGTDCSGASALLPLLGCD